MAKSKKEKMNEARKNAEALKAKKKQIRQAKGSAAVAAQPGKKGASIIKKKGAKK